MDVLGLVVGGMVLVGAVVYFIIRPSNVKSNGTPKGSGGPGKEQPPQQRK